METTFTAEIKEVKMVKSGLDNVYSIRLITDNSQILALGALPSDLTVKVTIS